MTTRQSVVPRIAPRGSDYNPDYYLTPIKMPVMRNNFQRQVKRIQTMPPSSEDPIGIYSYLDQENMDDHIAKTLEAIESGEFSNVPEEVLNWYNSIALDNQEAWNDDTNIMKQQTGCNYEYIDSDTNRLAADPPKDYEEGRSSIKENKRIGKGDKMNFIKYRLNQFLSNNFKGIRKNQVTKRPQASSVSEPIDKYCAGVLVTSNSFDDSVSFEYFQSPKKRTSTEAIITQMPNSSTYVKDDSFYLESSKHDKSYARQHSKSLENVFIPTQPPTPTPLNNIIIEAEGRYLVPRRLSKPVPPPRISSRIMEPNSRGRGFDANLTQDYIEPRLLTDTPIPKTSVPTSFIESPKLRVPHRNHSTGSRMEYIIPEDTPCTPMTRFNKDPSIPVLSPDADYNDPLDFEITELRQAQTKKYRPLIHPKPHIPKLMPQDIAHKPTLPPKPRAHAPQKPNKPKFLSQNSASRPAEKLIELPRHSQTVVNSHDNL
ncbi:hypothetical protein LOD99_624 [Oopsacas minuta]|uniref:Uncharacterized protein n=1 Tax=Oopsacas minuta TaxID=111878 RepID=A0AAV7JZH0_9METZ|nr:hypothetical protein LOD99_624 [Oopsacas minuta]